MPELRDAQARMGDVGGRNKASEDGCVLEPDALGEALVDRSLRASGIREWSDVGSREVYVAASRAHTSVRFSHALHRAAATLSAA